MAIVFNDNIDIRAPKDIDIRKGKFSGGVWKPFDTVSEALSTIVNFRYEGLTIPIRKNTDEIELYWFQGGINNANFVPFLTDSIASNLQEVTTGAGNNVTSNALHISGATGFNSSQDGLAILFTSGNSSLGNFIGGVQQGGITFTTETSLIPANTLAGRTSGEPAINNTEYTTLGQNNTKYGSLASNNNWTASNTFSLGGNSVTINPMYVRAENPLNQYVDITSQSIEFHRDGNYVTLSPSTPIPSIITISLPNKTGVLVTGLEGQSTIDFPSIGGNSFQQASITVTGAEEGDFVILGLGATAVSNPLLRYFAYVAAPNTVIVRCYNDDSSPYDPVSVTIKVKVIK